MKILVTGGAGFIGSSLAHLLPHYGHETIAPNREQLDMTDFKAYEAFLKKHKPDAIVHTAFKGHFGAQGGETAFVDNLKMYETLWMGDAGLPTVIFGSGAEFDRRFAIENAAPDRVFDAWPIDLYGLSKNIISRRFMDRNLGDSELENPFLLRLFGCFGPDEPEYRFIKRSINRLKQGLPIEIEQDKYMDFFYIDDVAAVINRVVHETDIFRHMNLTYDKKYKLSQVAELICSIMKVPTNITIVNPDLALPYTGNSTHLSMENIDFYGLEQGIARMVKDLE